MLTILTNESDLHVVFKKYTTMEAFKVKKNILNALALLNLPSEALLKQMRDEGLDLEHFDIQGSEKKDKIIQLNLIHESAPTIIQRQLFRLFLNAKELSAAIKPLDMTEGLAIRRLWYTCFVFLNLPSAELLSKMVSEGVLMADSVKSITEPKDKYNEQHKSVQATLAKALTAESPTVELNKFKLAVIKAKLALSDNEKGNETIDISSNVLAMSTQTAYVNSQKIESKDEKETIKNEDKKYPRLVSA